MVAELTFIDQHLPRFQFPPLSCGDQPVYIFIV
jgi:hypothetical protein